jgi:hypothetical protein
MTRPEKQDEANLVLGMYAAIRSIQKSKSDFSTITYRENVFILCFHIQAFKKCIMSTRRQPRQQYFQSV